MHTASSVSPLLLTNIRQRHTASRIVLCQACTNGAATPGQPQKLGVQMTLTTETFQRKPMSSRALIWVGLMRFSLYATRASLHQIPSRQSSQNRRGTRQSPHSSLYLQCISLLRSSYSLEGSPSFPNGLASARPCPQSPFWPRCMTLYSRTFCAFLQQKSLRLLLKKKAPARLTSMRAQAVDAKRA